MKEYIIPVISSLVVVIVGLLLERRMRKGDELRLEARKHDEEHREEIQKLLRINLKQTAWMIRKMTELVATHNITHPAARVELEDYPNGSGD